MGVEIVTKLDNIKNKLESYRTRQGVSIVDDKDMYEFSCGILNVDITMGKKSSCELRLSGDRDVYAIFWNTSMADDQIESYEKKQLDAIDAFFNARLVSLEIIKNYPFGLKRKVHTYAIQTDTGIVDFKGRKVEALAKITVVS